MTGAMQWNLGLQGVGLLAAMSLGFGVVAVAVMGRWHPLWTGLAATAWFFVAGVLISEVWFGWATQEDLQPNIDGLSFDEVLLIGGIPSIAGLFVIRHLVRRRHVGQEWQP